MSDDRYPKICFYKLKDLDTRFPNNNEKYNWVTQINNVFFNKIGVTLEEFWESNKPDSYIDFFTDKMKRDYLKNDIEKSFKIKSLYFSRILNYEISQPLYFNQIDNLKELRIIAQTRLSNIYNPRILLNNGTLKPKPNEYCYCCCTTNDLAHIINDCYLFSNETKLYFNTIDNNFVDLLGDISNVNVKLIIKLLETIYRKYENLL